MYIVCPHSLSIVSEISYGIGEGFIEFDKVIISYLIFLHLK